MEVEEQNSQTGTTPGSSFSKVRVFAFSVIALLVLLATALAVWFMILSPQEESDIGSTSPTSPSITVPDVKSDKDLEKLEKEVRGTDVGGLSEELNANDTDSKDF
jgi:hypothetical protein